MKPENPKRSLQKIRAHTCDGYWSGSDALIKFHICKREKDFYDPNLYKNALNNEKCCKTNFFHMARSGDQNFDIDKLKDVYGDGGEQAGGCEYFQFGSNTTF